MLRGRGTLRRSTDAGKIVPAIRGSDERDPVTTTPEDGEDHWPTFTLGPTEYEQAVADIATSVGQDVTDWRVLHLDPVDGLDGTYIIDVTVRFQLAGMDFLVLFECKRHASPVKREHVQVLHAKLR